MIGGNVTAVLQVSTTTKNEIGESVKSWHDVLPLTGWLDLSNGDSKRTVYSAKVQESTHMFICGYKPIPETLEIEGKTVKVTAESCRMVANTKRYDVLLIDDPMELHEQLEIYLKYTGGNDMSVKFEDNSINVKAALNDATIAWLYEAAGEVEARTKRNSRVDTGDTKASWSYLVDEEGSEAVVGSMQQNAIWEEFGTGEYAVKGNGHKGGWHYVDAKGKGHFTRGKTPNRTLERAFTSAKTVLKKRFAEILKEIMGD